METRSDRVRNTASCSSSGIAVKVPIVTRPTGKRGGSAGTSKKFIGCSRQIGMFQPVDEALACDEDLASSGLGDVRRPSILTFCLASGHPLTPEYSCRHTHRLRKVRPAMIGNGERRAGTARASVRRKCASASRISSAMRRRARRRASLTKALLRWRSWPTF